MDQLSRWKTFNETRSSDLSSSGNILMIILQKDIRPNKGAFMRVQSRDIDWVRLNYYIDADGNLLRRGRYYFSPEMKKILDWCNDNGLTFSPDIKPKDGPFMDSTYLEIQGPISPEVAKTFPIPTIAMRIV